VIELYFRQKSPEEIYLSYIKVSRVLSSTEGQNLLKTAMNRLNPSARAYDRILKVSRTIADLANSEDIKPEHLVRRFNPGV